jgi:diapolycopene oxygenase
MKHGAKRIVVIGAGLGGLSAAISLAQEGYEVAVHEKNERIGGKLNELKAEGYTFDLGPSILTLPHLFERLFERSGRRMSDYFTIRPLRPHWRNFFEDGTVVDLYPERERMAEELARIGEDPERFQRFLDYSGELYDLVDEGYFEHGLDDFGDFLRHYGLRRLLRFDAHRTMHDGVARRVGSRYMRDILDYFIKYVGSSAYHAPGFMNLMPTIQFRYDLWYVEGGLYNIARGLARLLDELGVEVHLHSEVTKIRTEGDRAMGIVLGDGRFAPADVVVCNMEVVPAHRQLLDADPAFLRRLRRFEPACSGLVLDLGLDIQYPALAHHNFFFSSEQKKHFHTVFRRRQLPEDPTIYLVAASRTDPTVAPQGRDCLKILPHIPYIDEQHPLGRDDYLRFKEVVLDKLERMGLTDLRKHVVFEHVWTPLDIRDRYYSNGGSIYGVVSDRWRNQGFKAPKQSGRYENLFFTGGSVNPGGGMPMVVLCGQNVCRKIVEWDRGTPGDPGPERSD